MKALVIKIKPNRRYLVELHTDGLVQEIAILVAKKKHSEAVRMALSKGRIEREVTQEDITKVKADVLLAEER